MILKYIESFLSNYPEFRIYEVTNDTYILKGTINRTVSHCVHGDVMLDYCLALHIPSNYPSFSPVVYEESKRIENIPENHINYDGSLCLGTPFRIKAFLKKNTSLVIFFEECILPYLYGVTLKLTSNKAFVFGETAHGNFGIVNDLKELFQLNTNGQVLKMVTILSIPKKLANKQMCPCGCKSRLTVCTYFKRVLAMRNYISRAEWEDLLKDLKRGY